MLHETSYALLSIAACLAPPQGQSQDPAPPGASPVELVKNAIVSYFPTDLAVTPDGSKAVVRTTLGAPTGPNSTFPGRTYVFSLVPPYTQSSVYTEGGFFGSSNWLATTNDRCLSVSTQVIGTPGQTNPVTHAQILDISNPAAITEIPSSFPLDEDTWDVEVGYRLGVDAGFAHHFRGVAHYDLTSGAFVNNLRVPLFKTGNLFPNFSGYGRDMSDSIEITSDRVFVIANRSPTTSGPLPIEGDGYVGIAEITNSIFPTEKTFGFRCDPDTYNPTCSNYVANPEFLHDLTTSPNGVFGIASGQGVLGIYNLSRYTELKKLIDDELPIPHMLRAPWRKATADSVEATDTRAVVIGNDSRSGFGTLHWRVTVVSLSHDPAEIVPTHFGDPHEAADSTAHDVAITPNGSRAVVTTRYRTLVFNLTSSQPGYMEVDTGADPLRYPLSGPLVIVANSVAVTNRHAAVIGRNALGDGVLSIIDFVAEAATNQVVATFVISDPGQPGAQFIPTDVEINDSGTRVIVRSTRAGAASSVTNGRLDVYNLDTLQHMPFIFESLGGPGQTAPPYPSLGHANGLEQLAASYNMAVSGGNDASSSSGRVQLLKIDQ